MESRVARAINKLLVEERRSSRRQIVIPEGSDFELIFEDIARKVRAIVKYIKCVVLCVCLYNHCYISRHCQVLINNANCSIYSISIIN